MLTIYLKKLLELDLRQFPLMAAASASIKGCSTCPHNKANKRQLLRAAVSRMLNNPQFKLFLKQHFRLPVVLAGIVFKEN